MLTHGKHHGFSEEEFYAAYKLFFGTLGSEPRLRIINCLRKKKRNVSELMSELDMDQTSISHNLARLRRCGFVEVKSKGKFRSYSLNKTTIKPLMDIIDIHMRSHCIHILRSMTKDKKLGDGKNGM